MHRRRQQQPSGQVQQRRKWGDWSECSADCVKTRHRNDCDDIVGANQANNTSVPQPIADNSSRRQQQPESSAKTSGDQENEDELLLKADQIDDDDYADEGDELEATDTCETVENSKTFEQVVCRGGLCPLPGAVPSAGAELASFGDGRQAGNSKETRMKHLQLQQMLLRKQQAVLAAIRQRESNEQRQQLLQLEMEQQKGNSPLSGASLAPGGRQRAPGGAGGQLAANSRLDDRQPAVRHIMSQPVAGATTASDTKQQANEGGNSLAWTRAMWPPQLLAPELGPYANLIQWTILIGSLLAILLLILLILRKLFPSYQWMVAKQTLKSSSKLGQTMDCCRYSSGSSSVAALAAASSSRSLHKQLTHQLPHRPPRDGPHQHYAWPLGAHLGAHPPGKAQPGGQVHRCLLEAGGRCQLASESAKFNTDFPPPTDGHPSRLDHSLVHSNSSRRASNRPASNRLEGDGNSLTSNYNYDTLNSASYAHSLSAAHKLAGSSSLADEPPDCMPQVGHQRQHSALSANFVPASNDNFDCAPPEGATLAASEAGARAAQDHQARFEAKHRSPNVPRAPDSNCQNSMNIPERDHSSKQEQASNSSRSSSISSTSLSARSRSLQSTTAQMLSNAASSSFEIPPELTPDGQSSLLSVVSQSGQLAPPLQSPASVSVAKVRPSFAKFASSAPQTVQSQPNSPMFVNQFNSSSNRAQQQALRCSQARAPNLSSRLRALSFQDGPAQASDPRTSGRHRAVTRNNSAAIVEPVASGLEATLGCDSDDDRHFYEEIKQQCN